MEQAGKPRPREGEYFLEPTELEEHFGLYFKVDEVLHVESTPFQELAVVQAGPLGRILLLDGNVQVSQFDEPAYHEMLVHVPLLAHPDPRRVLIIGGGDGGTLREVLKHPSVELAELCEIDEAVIRASKEFFPELAVSFSDPRARVHIGDGIEFAARAEPVYDVILVDSSDPEGPAVELFREPFYRNLRRALRPGGVMVAQVESYHLYAPLLREIFRVLPGIFDRAWYYLTQVPTYLSGIIGFAFATTGPDPLAAPDPRRLAGLGPLQYYTPQVARAAFELPARCRRLIYGEQAETGSG